MSAPGALCDISCKCNDLSLSGAKADSRVRSAFLFRRRHLTAMFGAKVSSLHCEGDGSHDLLLRRGDRRA